MAFTAITVTRRYLTAELTPATGKVTFTPTAPMVNGDTVVAAPRADTLDAEGDLTISVAATNDPTTSPPGVSYEVREQIDGQPTRTYYVTVPYNAAGGTVDLSTLTPAAVPPVVTYPVAGPQGPAGPNVIGSATDLTTTGAAVGKPILVSGTGPLTFGVNGKLVTAQAVFGPSDPGDFSGALRITNGLRSNYINIDDAAVNPADATRKDYVDAQVATKQPLDSDLTAIAALAPANDDIVQRKSGAWVNRTLAQLRTDLYPWPAVPAGQYIYTTSPQAAGAVNTLGNSTLRVVPWIVERTISIDRLVGDISAVGEAGSLLRMGIYADDGGGYPGSLIVDGGTIAGDSATVQQVTISTTLTPGVWWIGAAVQAAATTQPTVRIVSGWHPTVPLRAGSALPGAASTQTGYSMTGVTAALPASFSATPSAAGQVPRLLVRAA